MLVLSLLQTHAPPDNDVLVPNGVYEVADFLRHYTVVGQRASQPLAAFDLTKTQHTQDTTNDGWDGTAHMATRPQWLGHLEKQTTVQH